MGTPGWVVMAGRDPGQGLWQAGLPGPTADQSTGYLPPGRAQDTGPF